MSGDGQGWPCLGGADLLQVALGEVDPLDPASAPVRHLVPAHPIPQGPAGDPEDLGRLIQGVRALIRLHVLHSSGTPGNGT